MARICTCHLENNRYWHPSIVFEDIELNTWGKIPCDNCGKDREDDTPDERIKILVEEITSLRERLATLEGKHNVCAD